MNILENQEKTVQDLSYKYCLFKEYNSVNNLVFIRDNYGKRKTCIQFIIRNKLKCITLTTNIKKWSSFNHNNNTYDLNKYINFYDEYSNKNCFNCEVFIYDKIEMQNEIWKLTNMFKKVFIIVLSKVVDNFIFSKELIEKYLSIQNNFSFTIIYHKVIRSTIDTISLYEISKLLNSNIFVNTFEEFIMYVNRLNWFNDLNIPDDINLVEKLNSDCNICSFNFSNNKKIFLLCCKQFLCYLCLEKWYKVSLSCPFCRCDKKLSVIISEDSLYIRICKMLEQLIKTLSGNILIITDVFIKIETTVEQIKVTDLITNFSDNKIYFVKTTLILQIKDKIYNIKHIILCENIDLKLLNPFRKYNPKIHKFIYI